LEIAIVAVPGAVPLDEARVERLVNELAQRPGARHMIAHAGSVSSGARAAAAVKGAVLWDRERLVAEAGAALVAVADPDPFHPAGGQSPLAEAAGRALGAAGSTQGPQPRPDARSGGRSTARTLAPARREQGEALLGALAPYADEDRARQIASVGRGAVVRIDLEWVPAYLIDFHLVAEVTTPREAQSVLASGTFLISAAGGEAEELEGPIEVQPPRHALDKAALAKALGRRRLTLLEARARAREEALARTERTVEARAAHGPVTVTETHRWSPRGSDVGLVARGLLLLPYFLVETERGLVTVNAGTGRLVRVAPFARDESRGGGVDA
jgi:hypothetical protein